MRFLTTRAATRPLSGLAFAGLGLAIFLLAIGLLAIGAAMCGFGTGAFGPGASAFAPSASGFDLSTSAFAKDKPLSWKPIEDALLRVNDSPPKEWSAYRTGKKNEPLVLQLGNRFLFIQSHDHQVFELDPTKIEHKTGELLWSPTDRPAKPLATSDWNVDDIGAAFVIKVKLDAENAVVDLQLPHPPEVGNLPQQAGPRQQPRRRNYFVGER
jgi:hypothetical protein